MIDITQKTTRSPFVLDAIARAAVATTTGVSSGPYGSIIHLPDGATGFDQTGASNVLNNFGDLSLSADKTTLAEGDPDPVMTCDDARLTGDVRVAYIVLLDGEVYATGTTPVNNGVAELTLVAPLDGIYEIFVYRTAGDYASGSVKITVNES